VTAGGTAWSGIAEASFPRPEGVGTDAEELGRRIRSDATHREDSWRV